MAKKFSVGSRNTKQEGGATASEIGSELSGQSGVQEIALDLIRIDGGTQIRVELNTDTVAQYADAMEAGAEFPALQCKFDGSDYWLTDGFHRFHAYRENGATVALVDVTPGTKRDAVLAAIGANATHGLQRSNADKRKAVETLLKDPEWSQWSGREIAKAAGVDRKTVDTTRKKISGGEIPQVVKGADGKSYTTKPKAKAKKPQNAREKAASVGLKSYLRLTDKAEPEAVAAVTKGKDLKAAKKAHEWLGRYIEILENT